MELVQSGCSVSGDWLNAAERGLRAMGVDDVCVEVTTGFAERVAEATDNPGYTVERGSGAVAARTVTDLHRSVIIVNYGETASRSPEVVERLFAHEAGHVVIDRRQTEAFAGHRDAEETDWQWWLKCFGGNAIIEFRIERALVELDYPLSDFSVPATVDDALLIANVEILNAVVNSDNFNDPAHLQDSLLSILDHFTKMLAYVVAPVAAGHSVFSPSQLSVEGQGNWADYVAPTWMQRIAFWSSISSVLQPVPVEAWRSILRKSATLEQNFLKSLGFEFSTEPNGGHGFWRTAGDDVFNERLSRALVQTDTRTGPTAEP